MARRPIFIPVPSDPPFVKVVSANLAWHPGFAIVQKRKNIHALHRAAASMGYSPVLEISTKSEDKLGRHLSAFHLTVPSSAGPIPLESAYQGSKVFELGGPYTDLYQAGARSAKRDSRLRSSGSIVAFEFDGFRFPTEPKSVFYDWLYTQALIKHSEWLRHRLFKYAAFTDIEFNPERSVSCQARSCAAFVGLQRAERLVTAIRSPEGFIETFSAATKESTNHRPAEDKTLF